MREQRKDRERLIHIRESIDRVLRYTQAKTFDDLLADDMMYYAVISSMNISRLTTLSFGM